VQFTVQEPDYRQAFWGFPHPSINSSITTAMVSTLYDRVIGSSVNTLAAAAPTDSSCDSDDTSILLALLITASILLVISMGVISYLYFFANATKNYSVLLEEEHGGSLQRGLEGA
jgi:hypothetical protein